MCNWSLISYLIGIFSTSYRPLPGFSVKIGFFAELEKKEMDDNSEDEFEENFGELDDEMDHELDHELDHESAEQKNQPIEVHG